MGRNSSRLLLVHAWYSFKALSPRLAATSHRYALTPYGWQWLSLAFDQSERHKTALNKRCLALNVSFAMDRQRLGVLPCLDDTRQGPCTEQFPLYTYL